MASTFLYYCEGLKKYFCMIISISPEAWRTTCPALPRETNGEVGSLSKDSHLLRTNLVWYLPIQERLIFSRNSLISSSFFSKPAMYLISSE